MKKQDIFTAESLQEAIANDQNKVSRAVQQRKITFTALSSLVTSSSKLTETAQCDFLLVACFALMQFESFHLAQVATLAKHCDMLQNCNNRTAQNRFKKHVIDNVKKQKIDVIVRDNVFSLSDDNKVFYQRVFESFEFKALVLQHCATLFHFVDFVDYDHEDALMLNHTEHSRTVNVDNAHSQALAIEQERNAQQKAQAQSKRKRK